jgi:hypothetical protein
MTLDLSAMFDTLASLGLGVLLLPVAQKAAKFWGVVRLVLGSLLVLYGVARLLGTLSVHA